MGEVPRTDWDMLHHWDWVRRAQWQSDLRARTLATDGGLCRAFTELARIIEAEVVLDCACGLGCRALCLAEQGLNVLGSDQSVVAVRHAGELAAMENAPPAFFRSTWAELPRNVPHYFDAVLCSALQMESEWDRLGAAMVGIFHALKPGGFLMFRGAHARSAPGAHLLAAAWKRAAPERVDWLYHDGPDVCARLRQCSLGADYIDERFLHLLHARGETRLESTIRRRPFYWNWRHWEDLTQMAGFCHLETREYPGYGPDGEPLRLNVAWKRKDEQAAERRQPHESPYLDA